MSLKQRLKDAAIATLIMAAVLWAVLKLSR